METKESGVQSKDFPLSASKVTCGEQLCGKENKEGSKRDIVMNSFFFSLEFYQRFRTPSWKTLLMSKQKRRGKECQ